MTTTQLPGDQKCHYAQGFLVAGAPTTDGHRRSDAHVASAVGACSPPPANGEAMPIGSARAAATLDQLPPVAITTSMPSGGAQLAGLNDGPAGTAILKATPIPGAQSPAGPSPEQPSATTSPESKLIAPMVPSGQQAAAMSPTDPMSPSPLLADPFLALAADVLDDLETVRIANENRLRQLTRDETDADGEERGFGLTLDHPDVARLAKLVDGLAAAEHQAELNLARLLRRHPLGPWVKAQRGVGEKQGARLLAAIGDPYINTLHGRPRTVSELWAFCGLHTVSVPGQPAGDTQAVRAGDGARSAPRRARGQKSNWSETARKRAYLVATSCIKTTGAFRDVYDHARAANAESVHPAPCVRCGPSGTPAPVGSPRSAGHLHAMAIRRVSKDVLKGLWREAKRLHEATS